MSESARQSAGTNLARIPVQTEVFVNPDGSVTFADLEAQMIAIARVLNPDDALACDLPGRSADTPAVDAQP